MQFPQMKAVLSNLLLSNSFVSFEGSHSTLNTPLFFSAEAVNPVQPDASSIRSDWIILIHRACCAPVVLNWFILTFILESIETIPEADWKWKAIYKPNRQGRTETITVNVVICFLLAEMTQTVAFGISCGYCLLFIKYFLPLLFAFDCVFSVQYVIMYVQYVLFNICYSEAKTYTYEKQKLIFSLFPYLWEI